MHENLSVVVLGKYVLLTFKSLDGTRAGFHAKFKKDEEEELFWQEGLLGTATAKSLLNTVYFYNGKLFGLRAGEHRNINVNNFEVGTNFIRFEENASKTYSGGLNNLKYIPREVKTFAMQ